MTDDVFKCQLKPIDAKDYKTAPTADRYVVSRSRTCRMSRANSSEPAMLSSM